MQVVRPWCLLAWSFAWLLLAAAPGHAQDEFDGTFAPDRDLDGYYDAFRGDDEHLYDFEDFEHWNNRKVDQRQLAELRGQWAAERTRVRALIDAMDPAERFLEQREQALKGHRFFKTIKYEVVEKYAPIYFFVQARENKPGYAKKTASRYGPWMRDLHKRFQADYVQPFDLSRRANYGAYAIAILATQGDYNNYIRAVRNPGLYGAEAFYDPQLRMAVLNETPFGSDSERENRSTALHEFVHALEHSYNMDRDGPPEYSWFNEGFAEYLSQVPFTIGRSSPEAFGATNRKYVERVTLYGSKNALLPFDILLGAKSYHDVKRATAPYGLPPDAAMDMLYRQSSVVMSYLHQLPGTDGFSAGQLFVQTALRGRAGPRSFDSVVADGDRDALARDFAEFVAAEYQRLYSRSPGRLGYLGDGSPDTDSTSQASRSMSGAPPAAAATSDPCPDLIARADPALLRRLALYRASQGNVDGALRLAVGSDDPALAEERRRLKALRALRHQVLTQAVGDGSIQLLVEWAGKKTRGHVRDVGETTFSVAPRKRPAIEFPLRAATPFLLTKAAVSSAGRHDGEALAYAWALIRNDSRRSNLESKVQDAAGDAGAATLRDVALYDELLSSTRILAPLDIVFAAVSSDDDGAEHDALPQLRLLLEHHREDRWVAPLVECLEHLARVGLGQNYEDTPQGARAFAGHTEQLAGDRVRISYDFSDARQLDDWKPMHEYMEENRPTSPALRVEPSVTVSGGALVLTGATCLRSLAALTGPSSVEWTATWRALSGAHETLQVAICDDGYGSNIACFDIGGALQAFDKQTGYQVVGSTSTGPILNTAYTLRFEHDGKQTVRFTVDGRELAQIPCGPLLSGQVVLWAHSDVPLKVSRVVLEGQLSDAAAGNQKQDWIEGQILSWR